MATILVATFQDLEPVNPLHNRGFTYPRSINFGIAYPSTDIAHSPVHPVGSWRSDVQYCLVTGLVLGCLFGAVFATFFVASSGGRTGLQIGTAILALVMMGVPLGGLMGGSAVWPFFLCTVQLWARGLTPLRLLRFLEDACDRHVLHTTGPVYQFRHARLQDRLAEGPVDPHRPIR
jgi:hypothetical protein